MKAFGFPGRWMDWVCSVCRMLSIISFSIYEIFITTTRACRRGPNHSTNVGPTGSASNDSSEEETPLIPGLPDDVSSRCLARVPRTYHANLKCVSKRWRDFVCGEEWRMIREKDNLQETWLYAFCEDDSCREDVIPKYCCYVLDPYAPKKYWKRIQDLPPCIVQRQCMKFEVLGQKAYLIGGRDYSESELAYMAIPIEDIESEDSDNSMPNEDLDDTIPNEESDDDVLNEDSGDTSQDENPDDAIPNQFPDGIIQDIADGVHCYDPITNSWCQAAPLSTPRCYFATAVLDGKIYAVGSQFNPDGNHTWETYDPITDIWTAKSDRNMIDHIFRSFVYNGKLYVLCLLDDGLESSGLSVAVYDPSAGLWHYPKDDLIFCGNGGIHVVADRRLFYFDPWEKLLRMWDEDRKEWMFVTNMSYLMKQCPLTCYRLVAIGKNIFFVGKGLFTAMLDVGDVEKGWKPLISVVTQPIPETTPVICKCMTI